jgi:LuxR family maltose regulon positive regulatory protein
MYLKTKLYPPSLSESILVRNRLFHKLDEASQSGKHTIVTAGPGFGKSTLVAQWFDRVNKKPAWISLDEKDNDLRRFLGYMVTALAEQYDIESKSMLTLLSDSKFEDFDLIGTMILESIAQTKDRVSIVFDDYHLISDDSIHQLIEYFLKHLPGNGVFIIISRSDPPVALSKLRLNQKLTEIREKELKFRREEIIELLDDWPAEFGNKNRVSEVLLSKTEGWAVGLRLAFLAMNQSGAGDEFIQRFSGTHTYVADYLMEEVLQGLDEEEEQLLLFLSLFDRFTPPLLNSVLQAKTSEAFEKIRKSGFFLIPLDEHQQWFRLHHLVRDLIKKRAPAKFDADKLAAVYTRSAQWFEQNDFIDEAIGCFEKADHSTDIVRLISLYGLKQIATGDLATLSYWLNYLPEQKRLSTTDLCILEGWMATLKQQFDRVAYCSSIADSIFNTDQKRYIEDQQAHVALLKVSYMIVKKDVNLEEIEQLLSSAEKNACGTNFLLHSIIQLYKGDMYQSLQDFEGALSAYKKASLYAEEMNDFSLILPVTTAYCKIYILQGHFTEAEEVLDNMLTITRQRFSEISLPKTGLLHVLLAMILFEENKTEEASFHLEKADVILSRTKDYDSIMLCYYMNVRLHLLHHEISQAKAKHEAAFNLSEKHHLFYYTTCLSHSEFLIRKQLGNRIGIEQCLDLAEKYDSHSGIWLGQVELTRIKTLFELGRLNEALNEAAALKQRASDAGASYIELHANSWISLMQWKNGRKRESFDALQQALVKAENSGIVRPLLDTGQQLVQLLKEFAADHSRHRTLDPGFLKKMLKAFENELNRTPQGMSDPLSARELEVLRLLASGLTNKEIGEQLYLALGTIKKHSNTIYQKLGVKNRIQAVEKARTLHLI